MSEIIFIAQGDYSRRSFGALVRTDGVVRNARIVDWRADCMLVEFANGEQALAY